MSGSSTCTRRARRSCLSRSNKAACPGATNVENAGFAGGENRRERCGAGGGEGPREGRKIAAPEDPRADLYAEVTTRIIAELEAGRVPWVQPWGRAGDAASGLPRNAATLRPYSGINILILWGAVIEHGYASQGWLTFRQAQAAGGCVRKGERGTAIVYADRFTPKDEGDLD